MHAPPSVTYPVGRSAFAACAAAVLVLAGLAAAVLFSFHSAPGWRQFASYAAVASCAALCWRAWLRSPVGLLRWDGSGWSWDEGGTSVAGQPGIALDFQSRLLLRWRGERGTRWLWLERASDVSHWDALRRAVYSRASTPVPAAGQQPPAAEQ
jgi:toxin CptA